MNFITKNQFKVVPELFVSFCKYTKLCISHYNDFVSVNCFSKPWSIIWNYLSPLITIKCRAGMIFHNLCVAVASVNQIHHLAWLRHSFREFFQCPCCFTAANGSLNKIDCTGAEFFGMHRFWKPFVTFQEGFSFHYLFWKENSTRPRKQSCAFMWTVMNHRIFITYISTYKYTYLYGE